jgi:hypothetical protein
MPPLQRLVPIKCKARFGIAGAQAEHASNRVRLKQKRSRGSPLPNPLNSSAPKASGAMGPNDVPGRIPRGPRLIGLEQASRERLRTLREHTRYLLHRSADLCVVYC